jgi:hypothetical protein
VPRLFKQAFFFIIFVFQGYNNNDKTHTTSDRPCRKTQTDHFLFLFFIVHDGAVVVAVIYRQWMHHIRLRPFPVVDSIVRPQHRLRAAPAPGN